MNERGVERDGCAGRAAAKEIHHAAFAHEVNGCFPCFRFSHSFNDGVEMRFGGLANCCDKISAIANVNDPALRDAKLSGGFQSCCLPVGNGDITAEIFGEGGEHESNRPGAEDEHVLSCAQLCVFDALHDARERFDERRVAERRFRFETQQIFLHKPRGNDNGLGVGAVEKKQIFAKIFLLVAAIKTFAAWRGIGHDDAVADLPIPTLDIGLRTSDFTDHAGQFVTEDSGRHDHFGVIAAFENLQVGAAGERGFDMDADFAGFQRRQRDVFDSDFLFAEENGGFHGHSVWLRMVKAEEKFLILRNICVNKPSTAQE